MVFLSNLKYLFSFLIIFNISGMPDGSLAWLWSSFIESNTPHLPTSREEIEFQNISFALASSDLPLMVRLLKLKLPLYFLSGASILLVE